ncbi:hypothetical protein IAU59_004110 [Kwoniella sp. CBS 9459]
MPELFQWPCDFEGCGKLVLRCFAICSICYEVRCHDHKNAKDHPCASLKSRDALLGKKRETKSRYLTNLIEGIHNHLDAIYEDLERLRPGHKCTIDLPIQQTDVLEEGQKMLGGFNVNFILTFDDGVKWALRVRLDRNHRPPQTIREANIRSEVTTLNVLRDAGIPTPAAWLPSYLESSQPIMPEPSFDYFFFEFMEGKKWSMPKDPWYSVDIPKDRLAVFIDAYAKHQIKMSEVQLPTKQIGCLTTQDGSVRAGPIIARGIFQTYKPPYLLGPFLTMQERYLAHIDAALQYITFGAVSTRDAVDAYLWHLELSELVSHSAILAEKPEAVYIKHDDEKGDHFLWNDQDEVIGVLDWEWAYATTKGEAFASPYILYENLSFLGGKNDMTEEETQLIQAYEKYQRPDLAECVENGRLYQRLTRIGFYDRAYRKNGFREPFGADPAPDFKPPVGDDEWRVYMMERYKDHAGLQKVMLRHKWTIERAKEKALEAKAEKEQTKIKQKMLEDEQRERTKLEDETEIATKTEEEAKAEGPAESQTKTQVEVNADAKSCDQAHRLAE